MRNQACFSISVLKQQDLHSEGNLLELQVQKAMLRLFPNLVSLCFVAHRLFLWTNQRQKYFCHLKHEFPHSVAAGETVRAWHNSPP